MEKECYTVNVNVLVPKDEAPTIDDAIDALGEKLSPWYWTGNIQENSPPPQALNGYYA